MYAKLTLNIEQQVIEDAKMYAKSTRRSVSKLVEDYLSSVSSRYTGNGDKPLGPITRELVGVIKMDKNPDKNHKNLLTEALMEKYL